MAQVERATSTGGTTYLTNTSNRTDILGENVIIPVYTPTSVDEYLDLLSKGNKGLRFGLNPDYAQVALMCFDWQFIEKGTIGVPSNEQVTTSLYCKDQLEMYSKGMYLVDEANDFNSGNLLIPGISIKSKNNHTSIIAGSGKYIMLGNSENKMLGLPLSINTTASGANVYVDPSNWEIKRSTSAKKYKKDIEDITKEYADNFFYNAQPVWYRSKCEADNDKSYYGYIADDVMNVEPRLVQYGKDNEPEGFSYDRVCALLHTKMLEQDKRIKELEQKLEALNG